MAATPPETSPSLATTLAASAAITTSAVRPRGPSHGCRPASSAGTAESASSTIHAKCRGSRVSSRTPLAATIRSTLRTAARRGSGVTPGPRVSTGTSPSVERVDLVGVLPLHHAAPDLHRRRQLPARPRQRPGQNPEGPDSLRPGDVPVGVVDGPLYISDQLRIVTQGGHRAVRWPAMGQQPAWPCLLIDGDEGGD